jgi:hypothetical protein
MGAGRKDQQRNPFDNDRIIIAELAKQRTIVFNPILRVFVATHGNDDSHRFERREMLHRGP